MIAVIKEEHDFSNLLVNIIYDEIIFENIDFFHFQKSIPILESYGYKAIVFNNCENISHFTSIFFSVLLEKIVFNNCIIDASNGFLTVRNQKSSNNSIKEVSFFNSVMIGKNISLKQIDKLTFINYEIEDKYYYALLSSIIDVLISNFYGFVNSTSTSTKKTEIIINKIDYFSEKILYKILSISYNISVYFEDGQELTGDYVQKVIKTRIRKEKISNLLNGN